MLPGITLSKGRCESNFVQFQKMASERNLPVYLASLCSPAIWNRFLATSRGCVVSLANVPAQSPQTNLSKVLCPSLSCRSLPYRPSSFQHPADYGVHTVTALIMLLVTQRNNSRHAMLPDVSLQAAIMGADDLQNDSKPLPSKEL